ncbi:MAG: histidine--tRNA ligase [Methanobacteriota archaeon]|nr:MAG: histidine--tRNA ligase [Euryarchaeota archaeon]
MRVGAILRFGGRPGRFWVSTTCEPRKRLWRASRLRADMPIERPRGTNDCAPEEMARRRAVEGILRDAAHRFGFREVSTPTIEHLDLFTTKSGPGIVNELYAFKDKGGRDLALRPEFTASIVRFYLSELRNLPKPIKVYSVGNVFRYEEPQKGRYREFTQFNAEIIGAPALQGDAEVVALAIECLRSVGVRDVRVRIGHIGMLRSFLKLPPEDQGKVLHRLDKRDFPALKAELARLGLERLEAPLRQYIELKGGPEVLDQGAKLLAGVGTEGFEYLRALATRLKLYGLEHLTFDLGVVRGLDYYTGMVFEVDSPNLGAEKQVMGGGAYTLAEVFGGEPVPQTGFAFGLDRIVLAAAAEGVRLQVPRLDCYVIPIGEPMRTKALETLQTLRRAGVSADIDLLGRGPSKNLDYANAIHARFAVLVGEAESKKRRVAVKDLDSGKQEELELEALITRALQRPKA